MAKYRIKLNGAVYEMEIERIDDAVNQNINAKAPAVVPAPIAASTDNAPLPSTGDDNASSGKICSLMPGTILKLNVSLGDKVEAGQVILILEAMKMENEIKAPVSGTVSELTVSEGQNVANGELLCIIA